MLLCLRMKTMLHLDKYETKEQFKTLKVPDDPGWPGGPCFPGSPGVPGFPAGPRGPLTGRVIGRLLPPLHATSSSQTSSPTSSSTSVSRSCPLFRFLRGERLDVVMAREIIKRATSRSRCRVLILISVS